MLGESKAGMQCSEFDALLTDAVDGRLNSEQQQRFEQHKGSCQACAALFAEVRTGAGWLDELEEMEPPRELIRNILASTSAAQSQPAVQMPSAWQRLRHQLHAFFAPVLTPRFAMSMGMAFFSITLVLNMAQIRITDLTPHNLSHTFYTSENKVMRYYENMRLVYEIESRVRDLRNASQEDQREDNLRKHEKSDGREQNEKSEPELRRREYSRGDSQLWNAKRFGAKQWTAPEWIAGGWMANQTTGGREDGLQAEGLQTESYFESWLTLRREL